MITICLCYLQTMQLRPFFWIALQFCWNFPVEFGFPPYSVMPTFSIQRQRSFFWVNSFGRFLHVAFFLHEQLKLSNFALPAAYRVTRDESSPKTSILPCATSSLGTAPCGPPPAPRPYEKTFWNLLKGLTNFNLTPFGPQNRRILCLGQTEILGQVLNFTKGVQKHRTRT